MQLGRSDRRKMGELPLPIGKRDLASQGSLLWLLWPGIDPLRPFNPSGLASKVFSAGTRFLGTADATTSVALATITQIPSGSNTGTFSANMGFWNSTTNQNSGVLTGNYTTDTLTTRVTGTTNILGAASFAVYQISMNQFLLIGTASSDTVAVLLVI
jgi:hypothetical protein